MHAIIVALAALAFQEIPPPSEPPSAPAPPSSASPWASSPPAHSAEQGKLRAELRSLRFRYSKLRVENETNKVKLAILIRLGLANHVAIRNLEAHNGEMTEELVKNQTELQKFHTEKKTVQTRLASLLSALSAEERRSRSRGRAAVALTSLAALAIALLAHRLSQSRRDLRVEREWVGRRDRELSDLAEDRSRVAAALLKETDHALGLNAKLVELRESQRQISRPITRIIPALPADGDVLSGGAGQGGTDDEVTAVAAVDREAKGGGDRSVCSHCQLDGFVEAMRHHVMEHLENEGLSLRDKEVLLLTTNPGWRHCTPCSAVYKLTEPCDHYAVAQSEQTDRPDRPKSAAS